MSLLLNNKRNEWKGLYFWVHPRIPVLFGDDPKKISQRQRCRRNCVMMANMNIYHYTRFDSVESMLTNEGICIKAYHYSKYGDDDYAWTERIVTPIIADICAEKGWYFDPEDPVDPFLISFCKCENSNYMWDCFDRTSDGVALIFDRALIEEFACKDLDPDAFMDCIYTDNREEIRCFLLGLGRHNYIVESINDEQGDLKDISTFIIKPRYREEIECRYIIPHRKIISFSSDGNFSEEEIGKMDYREVVFPKEALVGIIISPQSDVEPEEILEILRQNDYNSDEVEVNKVQAPIGWDYI